MTDSPLKSLQATSEHREQLLQLLQGLEQLTTRLCLMTRVHCPRSRSARSVRNHAACSVLPSMTSTSIASQEPL